MTNTIVKTAQLFDEAEQLWFDIYEAPGLEGTTVTATVPREHQDAGTVSRILLSKGAVLPVDSGARERLQVAIAADAPVMRRAAQTGWRDDNATFVSHGHVAGAGRGAITPPIVSVAGSAGQARGDLAGWQELAGVARHSTAMTIALCAGFAAPLLNRLGRPSFALVLVGPSGCGKSTAQLLGASILGYGTEEEMLTLNATPAGLLAAGLAFNDHMMPINEVGTARGSKRDTYLVLHETTYALMSGRDVLRHPSWQSGGAGGPSSFQVLPLLSSERSPDEWAAHHGDVRDPGELRRLIGVPVMRRGRRTVFDQPPVDLAPELVAAWEREQFGRLRDGLPLHRGVSFTSYLDALVERRDEMTKLARAAVAQFERLVATPEMSVVARDISAKFGILYAAGILAIRLGILPLDKRETAQAVRRACLSAIAALPDPEAELRTDLARLRKRLSGGGIVNADTCSRKELRLIQGADGFREPRLVGIRFVVRAETFTTWCRSSLRTRRVLEWLDDRGFLERTRERTADRSNDWAQRQPTWPDGTRQRSIDMYLPGGLADLELGFEARAAA